MTTKVQVKIDNVRYSLNDINSNYENKTFRIPKYQRGYVWDAKKRGNLIDSLLRGYPVGSIILWSHKGYKYVLDGQQRTRSLLQIRKYPFRDMKEETFHSLFTQRFVEEKKIVLDKVLKALRSLTIDQLYKDPDEEEGKDILKDLIERDKTTAEVLGVNHKEVLLSLRRYIRMLKEGDKIVIPSIDIVESSEDDAIEIFDRLNSSGIELTRMEKLAAKWSSNIINLNNDELLKIIKTIYNHDESEDIRDTKENTPAEVVWAILQNSFANTTFFRELFTKEEKGLRILKHTHIDKLLWLIRVMVMKYNDIEINRDTLNDDFESDVDLGKKIKEICDEDEEWLINSAEILSQTWQKLEQLCPILKKEHNGKYIFINSASTNLFVSMAAQVFLALLEDDRAEINKTLQLVLIKETINGSYESSTNSVVKKTIASSEYMKEVTLKDVKDKLFEVNNLQKDEINNKNGFKNVAKLVISIAFSEYSDNKIDKYDYDHVFPKNWLKKANLEKGQNSIGNCGLLDHIQNREKQDKVIIDEMLRDKLITFADLSKDEYEKIVIDIRDNKDREKFNEYLDFRFKIISDLFIKNINPISK